jgi:hypothetical protein
MDDDVKLRELRLTRGQLIDYRFDIYIDIEPPKLPSPSGGGLP